MVIKKIIRDTPNIHFNNIADLLNYKLSSWLRTSSIFLLNIFSRICHLPAYLLVFMLHRGFFFFARRQSYISSCSFANPALDVADLRYGKLCSDVLPFLSRCSSSHKAFCLQSLTKTTHSELRSDTHRSCLHLQLGWSNISYIFFSRRSISLLLKHSGQPTLIYNPLLT